MKLKTSNIAFGMNILRYIYKFSQIIIFIFFFFRKYFGIYNIRFISESSAPNAQTNLMPSPDYMKKLTVSFSVFRDKLNMAFAKIHGIHLYDGNEFGSLFSPLLAVGMLLLGSKGDTDSQIRKNAFAGWKFNDQNLDEPHLALLHLIKQVTRPYKVGNGIMSVDNRFFIQQGLALIQQYLFQTAKYYRQNGGFIDFVSPEAARNTINNWVLEATSEDIEDLLPKNSLSSFTKLVIISPVYFYGSWKYAFNPSLTQKRDFSILINKTKDTVQVDMMSQEGYFEFYKPDAAEVMRLNFSEDRMSMFIILPDTEFGLVESFKYFDYKQYENTKQVVQANIFVPKFEIQAKYNFSETLPVAGIKDLFDGDKANLSGISTVGQLFVNEMHQQAFIRIDEKGTDAAIAVGSVVNSRAGTKQFVCDHPFLYMIVENTFGNVLFEGSVANPSIGMNDKKKKGSFY